MAEMFNIIEWLQSDMLHPHPGNEEFRIDPAEINNVLYFALVWNAFEDVLVGAKAAAEQGTTPKSASPKIIRQAVEDLRRQRLLMTEDFDPFLDEFRKRYLQDDGNLKNFNFNFLKKEVDQGFEQNLIEVIKGTETNPVNVIFAMLTIAWRLRNNLFHGIKFVFDLPEQNENFGTVNAMLAKFTRVLKNSGWVPHALRAQTAPPATPAS